MNFIAPVYYSTTTVLLPGSLWYTNKWNLHKAESVLENETLWNFEIQTDHLIPTRRPCLVLINKKKRDNLPSCGPLQRKITGKNTESEKIDKHLDLACELKKI